MTDIFLITDTPEFHSDLCDEIRLFFPVKKIPMTARPGKEGLSIKTVCRETPGKISVSASVYSCGRYAVCRRGSIGRDFSGKLDRKKKIKYILKHTLYRALSYYTGKRPPWGSLTGIRPTKLTRDLLAQTEDPYRYIMERYDVSARKAGIARRINQVQAGLISDVTDKDLDIYIGIPFCRTRCTYCSFISREYGRNLGLKDRFLECLAREMESIRPVYEGHRIRCLYVGGGTPTALEPGEFSSLLDLIGKLFPDIGEYTVEAGRPDTITDEKLRIMKDHGVIRISVNPQTTDDDTLLRIGRPYGNGLFLEAYSKAAAYGFDSINCDVILGLPGEDLGIMEKTLRDVASLRPEDITVHTLAIKNSSYLRDDPEALAAADDVGKACDLAYDLLTDAGYDPYYLYRQKYMTGNHENIGYARDGFLCRYYVDNMEETFSVLAFGAGAISKRIFASENRIERACNVKDLAAYCSRTDDMTARKKALFSAL